MRIALVEDNVTLARGISYRLEDMGHTVDLFHDGDDAAFFLRDSSSDLVILDINLPGQSGLEILKGMRNRKDPRPVILLTARSGTDDMVTGLDMGADDYLVKPFEMEVLEARIRALARRKQTAPRRVQSIGELELDLESRQLRHPTGGIDLPRRELSVFECLLEANGRTVSKSALLERVYGIDSDVEESVVEVYVSRLRKRLKPHGIIIRVQRGIGYDMTSGPAR